MYKQVHLEIDINNKSDRIEWGHCRYHSFYRPDRAFELVVQWMAASGTIVADLISGWARKSQTCGIQMIPIPGDPLSLPFNDKSDPLRGPIFVPLDTECLMGSKSYLFQEFPEETWDTRLVLLQEAIVQRFGFIACVVESRKSARASYKNLDHHHHQYVHVTGNIFILIPSTPCSKLKERMNQNTVSFGARSGSHQSTRRYPMHSEIACSPHEEYITRHVNGNNRDYNGADSRPGFLWFWNHMVSRRWKSSSTPATGDEAFQNKILKDFREFCSNEENRLKAFWDSSYEIWKNAQNRKQQFE